MRQCGCGRASWGRGGVTEEAPGPRDREAGGAAREVKNCYGKNVYLLFIDCAPCAETRIPSRDETGSREETYTLQLYLETRSDIRTSMSSRLAAPMRMPMRNHEFTTLCSRNSRRRLAVRHLPRGAADCEQARPCRSDAPCSAAQVPRVSRSCAIVTCRPHAPVPDGIGPAESE